ncbi:MAG TPA: hypothetical protein VLB50_12020 [Ignavibacteriaceae bacterium]|nr:hypothetical protein [Ignavibacteriaceae bacterium]
MYEHKSGKLLPRRDFYKRVAFHGGVSFLIVIISLGIGVLGYHLFESFSWIDSLLNASMILGGMGPVNEVKTQAGKIFASFYALFSGIIFLVIAGVIFTPIYHRFMHKFHLEIKDE